MMANIPLIELVKRQALITFSKLKPSCSISPNFEEDFNNLRSLVNKVTSEDVNLDTNLLKPVPAELERNYAPVNYIGVMEDPSVTIGIFVLRKGSRLPLHDHPLMYGVLKVIHGSVQIQSYSIIKDAEVKTTMNKVSEVQPNDINLSQETINRQVILTTIKEPSVIISSKDDACVLCPLTGNIHEIHSVNGPAAFLDVLSPPYETEIPGVGPRPCRYFKEIEEEVQLEDQEKKPVAKLMRIPSPRDYWSQSSPYQGP